MSIRVVTLNVWALPLGMSRLNSLRMHLIGESMQKLDADVFAFQEVWTQAARVELLTAGQRAGYVHVWHRDDTIAGSGLLVLSRVPILEQIFSSFTLSGLPQRVQHGDWWAGKGMVLLRLAHADGELMLLNTHLLARYVPMSREDEYLAMRVAEVVEIASVLANVDLPVIALGDFNIREDSIEYRVLQGLSGLVDVAAHLNMRQDTRLSENPYRHKRSPARIDYVFMRAGRQRNLIASSVRRIFDKTLTLDGEPASASDHSGLLAELELEVRPTARYTAQPEAIDKARASLKSGAELAVRRQRSERGLALACAGTATLLAGRAKQVAMKRRRFLRAGAVAATGLSTMSGAMLFGLSEFFVPEEIQGYADVEAKLDALI